MTVFATVLPQASIMHFGESNDRIFALSADSARAMGERYLMNSQPDSALLYFDIVVKRYNADSNPRRCRILVDAYIHEWSIYFGTYYDYYRSYESLYKAGEVCAASGMVDARVNLYLGGMYQTIYEQIGDNDVADKALAYYTKAYEEAIATHNDIVTDLVFMNISSLTSSIGNFAVTEKLWESYGKMSVGGSNVRSYNHLWYAGLKALNDRRYTDAVARFSELLDHILNSEHTYRLCYMATLYKSKSLAAFCEICELFKGKRALFLQKIANFVD